MHIFSKLINSSHVVVEEKSFSFEPDNFFLKKDEEAVLEKAVPKRRREFILGRYLAHEGLKKLEIYDVSIPSSSDRSPVWPDHVVGSITHSKHWCAAALSLKSKTQYIGLDIESSRPMDEPLIKTICSSEEIKQINNYDKQKNMPLFIFSAKEALYKALYPQCKSFLGFKSVLIEFCFSEDKKVSWQGTLLKDWGPLKKGDIFKKGCALVTDKFVATAYLKYR